MDRLLTAARGPGSRALLLAGALLASAGCQTAWARARAEDSVDGWRRYLVTATDPEDRDAARRRIEVLLVRDAERAGSVRAWARVLAEAPDGAFAARARRGLVEARRSGALARGDEASLARFLARHPRAPGAEAVRRALAARRVAGLEAAPTLAAARALAEDFPDTPEADRARRVAEDLMLAAARTTGTPAEAERYLDAFPRGARRDEALALLEEARAREALSSEDERALRAFLARYPASPRRHEVAEKLAAILLARAERTLDPDVADSAVAVAPAGSPVAARAAARARALRRGGRRVGSTREAIATLSERFAVRPVPVLREALASSDALDAWDAVRELALSDDPASFEVLLGAAGASNPLTAFSACVALPVVVARLGLGERATERVRVLSARQANPEDRLRLGALRDALGDAEGALVAYEAAATAPATAVAGGTLAVLRATDRGDVERARRVAGPLLEEVRARAAALALPAPDEADARAAAAPGAARSLHGLATLVAQVATRLAAQVDGLPALAAELAASALRAEAEARVRDARFRPAATDAVAGRARQQSEARVRAARQLGRSREPAAREALVAAREDADPAVRTAVAEALGGARAP